MFNKSNYQYEEAVYASILLFSNDLEKPITEDVSLKLSQLCTSPHGIKHRRTVIFVLNVMKITDRTPLP
jgi:hypothetical protein